LIFLTKLVVNKAWAPSPKKSFKHFIDMSDSSSGKPHKSFSVFDFLWRVIAAIVLVLLTFNPSGYSYFHWFKEALSGEGAHALHYFLGVILLAGWAIFVVATSRSLGTLGSLLSAAVIGTGIWLLADIGIVQAGSATAVTWLSLVALAILLAVGLSWAHIWRRLSGQLEVDEVDD